MTLERNLLLTVSAVAALALAGCPSPSPTCSSPPVTAPGGVCSAYYYKTDYGAGGATTQALVDCNVKGSRLGGNVVAFHVLNHGIGLQWLDERTLEVAVPAGVKLENQRDADVYNGYALTYRYRALRPDEVAFSGCRPQ